MTKGRRTTPTPEDLKLWQEVTRSVAPLAERPSGESAPRSRDEKPAQPAGSVKRATRTTAAPALSPIDRRTVSRLRRGTASIDVRIDLHGMTQAAAHGRLKRFLREAQTDGVQLALVITGKGRRRGDDDALGDERGVLRRMVPLWLAAAELRPYVVGFGEAGPAHGGVGALYVRIRRKR